jgi:flagellar motility protein MotE (MotC chaperone)
MSIMQKIRILPLLMVVAMLAFAVRVGEFASGLERMGAASAQEEVKVNPPPMEPKEDNPADEIKGRLDLSAEGDKVKLRPEFESELKEPPALPAEPGARSSEHPQEWRDATDTEIDHSEIKSELYKDLASRREQLDKREKEIVVREALLSAAERELDQKLRELTNLKGEIESSMKKRSEEEDARITSLVKIYEGMKAKDAASIFNTLDLDVLMTIMTKMSERKSSSILAEMNQDRARTITIMMAEQKPVPPLGPEN